MIDFYSETDFQLSNQEDITHWISNIIEAEKHELGDITFVFCDDNYLHKLNVDFLNHDTLTDIISFDNSLGKQVHGEIYISIDRVKENAEIFKVSFIDEIHRVIIHGIFHFCGFKDKSEDDALLMRSKEDEALDQRNFL